MLSALLHAPTLCFLPRSNPYPFSPPPMAASARIAVVGDVHNYWYLEDDTKALQLLQPDVVLFTGDFGEQNVELVQSVANLKFPKAVILGNHDAWYTQQFSGKRKDGVQRQLERYGVEDMDGSAKKIYKAALRAPEDHFVILLAHNGPTGLGSNLDDICGKDWVIEAGDHGDSDLEQAISLLKESNNVSVPLVVFGHMHKELAHGNGLRKMIVVGSDDTIYLNGAIVPRVKTLIDSKSFTQDEALANHSLQESEATMRAFTVVDISDGRVDKISESWVSVVGDKATLEEENLLFKRGN